MTLPIERIEKGPYLSRAVTAGDMVFLSGMVPDDLSADIAGQTAQVLAKIDRYLAAAGSSKSRLVSAQIWMRDIREWSRMNEVWVGWIDKANPPARATVQSAMADERCLVEIMVTAVKG